MSDEDVRREEDLQLMSVGFAWSSVLWTAIELGVFDALTDPLDLDALGKHIGVARAPLARLLSALTALGLVEPDGSASPTRYRSSGLANKALTRSGERSIVPLIRQSHRHFYELFRYLPDAVRSGEPQLRRWRYNRAGASDCYEALVQQPDEYAVLLEAMDAASEGVADVVSRQAGLAGAHHVVDFGHGGGRIARDLVAMHDELTVTAVDLGAALSFARKHATDAGLDHRIRFDEADLRRPYDGVQGADAVLLSGVLSDFDPETRKVILDSAYGVLRPGGQILVSETLFDEGRHGPAGPALLSLFMLLLTGGDNFTASEVERMLTDRGFTKVTVHRNGPIGVRDLVRGHKPESDSEIPIRSRRPRSWAV